MLNLADEDEYRQHYVDNFTRRPLMLPASSGPAPIYFAASTFDHAFFESTRRDGAKDQFSLARAERMDLLPTAISDPAADRRAGWVRGSYDHSRCVTIAVGDFVVIVRLGLTRDGRLRGNFVTCFVADSSIGKILRSPNWEEIECMAVLRAQQAART